VKFPILGCRALVGLGAADGCSIFIDRRGTLVDPPVAQLRPSAGNVVHDFSEASVGSPSRRQRILFIEQVLQIRPCDVIGPHRASPPSLRDSKRSAVRMASISGEAVADREDDLKGIRLALIAFDNHFQ
jgi:hypothetical protein